MSKVWQVVCRSEDVIAGTGVCAQLGRKQVAIFRTLSSELYALDNYDPVGKANVMSRGIQGSIGDKLVVASPLYKQHFVLSSGECLEVDVNIPVYQVREGAGVVEVATD